MRGGRHSLPDIWPVILSAAVLAALTIFVGMKLDADSASVDEARYDRFLDGAPSPR